FDVPSAVPENIIQNFKITVIKESTFNWHEHYGSLLKYVDENLNFPARSHFLGRWIGTQRGYFKNNSLEQDRIELLEAIDGWSWEPITELWEVKFQQLYSQCKVLGHARIGQKDELGIWVSNQRISYSKNKLSKLQIQKLESLPQWTWNAIEEYWHDSYQALINYQKENCSCSPMQSTKIGKWVSTQRQNYNLKSLDNDKIRLLEKIPGWNWNERDKYWNSRFNELNKYVEVNGTCDQVYDNKELHKWISTQRKSFNSKQLDVDKIRLLESIKGWHWNNNEYTWNKNFSELLEFVNKNSHASPKRSLPIGKWVSQQRLRYGKNQLSSDKIKRLEMIPEWGWTAKDATAKGIVISERWLNTISELELFTKSNKRFPKHRESDLGAWVSTQRRKFKDNKLLSEQIHLLEQIPGWQWTLQ
ncbi:helicase associated domain-containing protein, partial [bacterium]|nr:helicase associated domain-containing protein [bacterium]